MHKSTYIIALFFVLSFLSGCAAKPLMDQPHDDGKYYYQNKDLGFSLTLTKEFEYYQTQRVSGEGFIDLEFFVPTSDTTYPQFVPGYAKPIVIRVYERNWWEENKAGEEKTFEKIAQSGEKIYGINFWENVPIDWEAKWNDDLRRALKDSFDII